MGPSRSARAGSPSRRAGPAPRGTPDWRARALARIRRLIEEADPDAVEERKWKRPANPAGVPVWSHHGILCTGETYATHLRVTFARGASLEDPKGLLNSGQAGRVLRAIVLREGDEVDADGFRALVRAAAALNASSGRG